MIPSVESILAATRKVTSIEPTGGRKNKSALFSRRVAAYCLRVMRDMSYPEIAEALRSHHSVAIKACASALNDPGVMAAAGRIRRQLDEAA